MKITCDSLIFFSSLSLSFSFSLSLLFSYFYLCLSLSLTDIIHAEAHPQSQITRIAWLGQNQLVSTGQDSNVKIWDVVFWEGEWCIYYLDARCDFFRWIGRNFQYVKFHITRRKKKKTIFSLTMLYTPLLLIYYCVLSSPPTSIWHKLLSEFYLCLCNCFHVFFRGQFARWNVEKERERERERERDVRKSVEVSTTQVNVDHIELGRKGIPLYDVS